MDSLTAQSVGFEQEIEEVDPDEFEVIAKEANSIGATDNTNYINEQAVEQQLKTMKEDVPKPPGIQASTTFHAGGVSQRSLNQSGPMEVGAVLAALGLTMLWRKRKQLI